MPTSDQSWEIDTRHLMALAAIARTKSVSRAAAELNYVQSAVSQQLATLEKVVGHRLVDRGSGPRPVTLTAAGAALLPHALSILDRLEVARLELAGLDNGQRGSIQIGALHSVSARLLPQILASYRRTWPDISISIRNESATDDFLSLVRTGALDVAFVESYHDEPGIEHVELLKDRFVALVPPGHPLASRKTISVAQLGGEDLVGGALADSCSALGEQALRAAGFEPRVVFRTGDNPTRQRLVDAGLGCAIQPGLTVEPGLQHGGVTIELEDDLHRTISLVWSANRTASFALTTFLQTAEAVLSTTAGSAG